MARLVTAGGETSDPYPASGGWKLEGGLTRTATGPPAITAGAARSGNFGFNIATATAASGHALIWTLTGVSGTTYYIRAYFRYSVLPTTSFSLMQVKDVSAVSMGFPVQLLSDGTIRWGSSGAAISTETVAANQWFSIQLSLFWNGTVLTAQGEINNSSAYTATLATTNATFGSVSVGILSNSSSNTVTVDVDDIAINDSAGSPQNTWPGDGKLVLLVPTADSAVGTGWTLGTGTAISGNSGSTAVKNTPPLGVADLAAGSGVKQIRNASANASVSYDATMTTYSAAGIATGDTVNVVLPLISTGAPVVTSAKLGTVGVVSNPAITNVALGAGGTAGAFWEGNTAGTYSTGWKGSYGTVTYAPSVTLGTAPVMRVTQTTSSTRIAMVCFMGMYVDYTPAVVRVPYNNPMIQLLPQ